MAGSSVQVRVLSSLITGAVLALFATPVFCLLRKIFWVPLIRPRLLRQAEQQGHVVRARLLSSGQRGEEYTPARGFTISHKSEGVYSFDYQGRSYRYHYVSTSSIPEELTLYFQKDPRRACLRKELGLMESDWKRYYMVIAAVLAGYCFLFAPAAV